MAANFLHGAEAIEVESGGVTVRQVKTAVIGIVGAAAAGPVNTLTLVASDKDFVQFGANIEGSTILNALEIIYDQKPTVCIVVNVLDPTIHKSSVADEAKTLDAYNKLSLDHAAVQAVVVTNDDGTVTYAEDTDYTLNARDGKITRLVTGTITAQAALKISYDYADPTKVTQADIIGTITAAQTRTGMQCWLETYHTFGFAPKLLITPGYSQLSGVGAELEVMSDQLKAICFKDAPLGTTPSEAISGRGPNGTIGFNTSKERTGLCYPHHGRYSKEQNAVVLYPFSQFVAGAWSKKDQDNGFWWSGSNTELNGVVSTEFPLIGTLDDPNSTPNLLNEAGIITSIRDFGTGFIVWGNRSAAWPTNGHPKNFINIRRIGDIVMESILLSMRPYIDQPLNGALVEFILSTANGYIDSLVQRGGLSPGSVCYFDEADNPTSELAQGHLTLCVDLMGPTPLERLTFKYKFKPDLLKIGV